MVSTFNRVLVTGASGFIGRAVVASFAADGHAVRAAVRRPPQAPFCAGIEVMQHADFTQSVDWYSLLDNIDAVIHLGGIAHAGRGLAPGLYDRINRQTSKDLATAAAKAGVSRFVFISSVRAQSGPVAEHVLSERDLPDPTDAYGASKLAAEEEVRSTGVPYTILRPVLVYGRGVKGNLALLSRMAGLPVPLPLGSFSNQRSLLGLDNLSAALKFVLSSPETIGETYLVADPGVSLALSEIVTILRRAKGRRERIFPVPPRFVEAMLRALRQEELWERVGGNLRVDTAKFIAAGWQPLHDTREGLTAMAQ
jgi:UDP-glucose 4-epimerase